MSSYHYEQMVNLMLQAIILVDDRDEYIDRINDDIPMKIQYIF